MTGTHLSWNGTVLLTLTVSLSTAKVM